MDSRGALLGLTITLFDYDYEAWQRKAESLERMADLGSWSYQPEKNCVKFSPEFLRAIGAGFPNQTIDLDELKEVVHPDDLKTAIKRIQRAYENGRPFHLEGRIRTENERVVHVQATGTPVLDSQGKLVNFVGACRDITTSIRNSMILEKFEWVQNHIGLTMFSYDADNDLVFVTGAVLFDAGENDNSISNVTFAQFLDQFQSSSARALKSEFARLLKEGGSASIEVKQAGTRGTKGTCLIDMTARTRIEGAGSHVYGTIRRANSA
jgi:PAS domain S-box-containing protein